MEGVPRSPTFRRPPGVGMTRASSQTPAEGHDLLEAMLNEIERARVEDEVRALCEKGDTSGAATLALRAYGGEIFAFLLAVMRDETAAADAFSTFAEGLWRSLETFEWSASLRTWAYAIARNATRNAKRDAARKAKRRGDASTSVFENVAQGVRTETLGFLRTEKRSKLDALRDALTPEDRALLVLRVDRGLAWNELARVLSEGETPRDDAAIARESARLRKRYQLLKDKLRELAKREGLTE